MGYQHLRFERPASHVVRIVLDRPNAANALGSQLLSELADAVDRIASDDDVRVWMLTGAPRPDGRPWFSAGADLKEALGGDTAGFDRASELVDRIDDLLKPSIAVLDGVCTTGALELALACDLRLAATTARLSDWHLRRTGLGIGAWGMAARLTRLVGADKAKELILLGSELDGATAERIGLVNRAVTPDELESTALEWATTIAALPRRGVRTTMAYLSLQRDLDKAGALALAARMPELVGLELRPLKDAAERWSSGPVS